MQGWVGTDGVGIGLEKFGPVAGSISDETKAVSE